MKFGNQTRITTEQKRSPEEGGGRTIDAVIAPPLDP